MKHLAKIQVILSIFKLTCPKEGKKKVWILPAVLSEISAWQTFAPYRMSSTLNLLFTEWTTLTWVCRFPFCVAAKLHSLHLNGLDLRCALLMWVSKLIFWLAAKGQRSHMYGRSLKWILLKWVQMLPFWLDLYVQALQWYSCAVSSYCFLGYLLFLPQIYFLFVLGRDIVVICHFEAISCCSH